jgi:hypothetical protein
MRKIFFIIFILLINVSAFADTHTVSGDCSASAVQTAINAASGGDIIDVTCTGTVTWSSGVTISGGKTLKGGGAKTGNASTTTGSWPLVINITHSGAAAVTIVNAASQSLNRLTGFKFQGTGGPSNIINVYGVGVGSDSKGAFRIDNNYFNGPSYTNRVIATDGSDGKMTGLLDHNIIYYISSNSPGYGNISYQNNSHATSPTPCYGYDSWKRPTGFGTDDFVFYEDNYFMNSGIETSEGGGRVVVRYNYYNTNYEEYFSGLDGHGADTGGMYCIGIVADEFYKNDLPGSSMGHAVNMRGGKWMVHNNTLTNSILQIDEYRLTAPGLLQWKACDGDFCCPTTPAQCNIQAPQISDFATCYPVLNQVNNTFLWNNIKGGSNTSPTFVDDSATLKYYVALNRDYWMPTSGTEANLPATCTAGANTFYGATDSGKLWNCDTTNHWTLVYTPYTYPHPLRGETVATNYSISGGTISGGSIK